MLTNGQLRELPDTAQTLLLSGAGDNSQSAMRMIDDHYNDSDEYNGAKVAHTPKDRVTAVQPPQQSFKLPKQVVAYRPTHLQTKALKHYPRTNNASSATSVKAGEGSSADPYKPVCVYSAFSS